MSVALMLAGLAFLIISYFLTSLNFLICFLECLQGGCKITQGLQLAFNAMCGRSNFRTHVLINATHVMPEKRFYELCRGIFLSLQIIRHWACTRKKKTVNSIDALDTTDAFKPSGRNPYEITAH